MIWRVPKKALILDHQPPLVRLILNHWFQVFIYIRPTAFSIFLLFIKLFLIKFLNLLFTLFIGATTIHQCDYHLLAALDILTVAAISAIPKRLFFLVSVPISDRCNRLYSNTTEAIERLKS
jgi:hypothetical protein